MSTVNDSTSLSQVEGYVISPLQRAIHRSSPDRSPDVTLDYELPGPVDIPVLRSAFLQAAGRHDVLCSQYRQLAGMGEPAQVPGDEPALVFGDEPDTDPDGDGGYRLRIRETGTDRTRVTLSAPSFLADCASLVRLVHEAAAILGHTGAPPEDEWPRYADVAQFLNDAGSSEDAEHYWLSTVAHLSEGSVPAAGYLSCGSGRRHFRLSAQVHTAICQAADRFGWSYQDIVTGALSVVLARVSGHPRATVALGWEARSAFPELAGVFGPLTFDVPVSMDVRAGLSFAGLLDELRALLQQQQEHALSLPVLAPALSSAIPRYRIDFTAAQALAAVPDLALAVRSAPSTSAALSLSWTSMAAGTCVIDYQPEQYTDVDAELLFDRLEHVLAEVCADPGVDISTMQVMSHAEWLRTVVHFNATDHEIDPGTTVVDRFLAQVRRRPDALAVRTGSARLTYAELAEQAYRIAAWLTDKGVGPGDYVPLYLPRTCDAIAAMVGVALTRAAYVPLNPNLPALKTDSVLRRLAPRVVITADTLREQLPLTGAPDDVRVLCLPDPVVHAAAGRFDTPEQICSSTRPEGDDVAYVIFTSGSTGEPKGVVVRHKRLANVVDWVNRTQQVQPEDCVLLVTSFSFDLSVYDVWGSLSAGATIRLTDDAELADPQVLVDIIRTEPVSIWDSAPAALQRLVPLFAACGPDLKQCRLRMVMLSGDWIPVSLPDAVRQLFDNPVVLAMGGATEATIWSNFYLVAEVHPRWPSIPYGRPMQNCRYYVLDERLSPQPIGVPGELYIGGLCVADGYFADPEQTAHRFIDDPFDVAPGNRLYRTGDMVRHLGEGQLQFLGRNDDQVKIRGHRIELGEIAAALRAHSAVREVIVRSVREPDGNNVLVAYWLPSRAEVQVEAAELRSFLTDHLASYAIPPHVVRIEEIPVTSNGKVDYANLPDHRAARGDAQSVETATQAALLEIWRELLGQDYSSLTESFFAAGGHSLAAVQMLAKVQAVFGQRVRMPELVANATIRSLACLIDSRDPAADHTRPPLVPVDRSRQLPLSSGQRRMWFDYRIEGPNPTYNIPQSVSVRGMVDRCALRAALVDLVTRHEVLRTIYGEVDGEPVQHILSSDAMQPVLECVETTTESVGELMTQATRHCFDLTAELPIRAWLFTVGADVHLLLIVTHHIANDGWSERLVLRDLATAYEARSSGRPPQWSPLAVQYSDYAVWQRQLLGTPDDPTSLLSTQLRYWRDTLQGSPDELVLPFARSRPVAASRRGGLLSVEIAPDLHRRLVEIAREGNATLFMVLHAGLAALLTRLGAGTDLPIGTAVAGRADDALAEVIGFFVNTIVLRTDTSGDPSFRQLVSRVQQVDANAFAHQDVPFDSVVEDLNPTRSLSYHPLFQVMLLLQNNVPAEFAVSALDTRVEAINASTGNAKFDLFLAFFESRDGDVPAGLTLKLEYATDLFDRPGIQRMADALVRVLECVAGDPDLPIDSTEVLSEQDRHLVLYGFNSATSAEPVMTLTALLEAAAGNSASRTALVCGSVTLTYAELNGRANRLAHHLIAQGAGPEDVVALVLPRTEHLVQALLGVLKAGAAYLPIDPHLPAERVRYLIEDAGATVVITARSVAGILPPVRAGVRHLVLDEDATVAELACRPSSDPTDADRRAPLTPSNAAYVLYTSGSTGRPKGVVVDHSSIVRLASWAVEEFGHQRLAHVLFSTALHFDVSAFELFPALLCGGTVEMLRDALALAERDEAAAPATLISGVPSALAQIVTLAPVRSSGATLVLAGEAPSHKAALDLQRALSPCRIVNAYGPTEATVYATSWVTDEPITDKPLIGWPLPHCRAYVLDAALRPVPVGVAGELYLAGGGLARGYLNRPALTAQRFLPDPFADPGSRMYRTGDLARWTDNGLEYLGRIDHQVKIRGFRIELGEIEASLESQPEIAQAVVVVREDRQDDRRLVAYLRPASTDRPAPAEIRRRLARSLPEYMIPSAFVVLDTLPLNANGKLDRAALPAPEGAGSVGGKRQPRNDEEEQLCLLFADVLGAEKVSLDDDFFELGGHSLLAARLISRIRTTFGVELGLRTLFQAPTVADLTHEILTAGAADRPPLRSMPHSGVLPLSFGQQRLWLLNQLEGPSPTYNLPHAWTLHGELDPSALAAAFTDVVTRHEILRTVYSDGAGDPTQQVLPPDSAPELFEVVHCDRGSVDTLLQQAARRCFTLQDGPPVRAWLFAIEPDEHRLLVLTHHIASDGWSLRPLLGDLATAYRARVNQEAPDWPALPVQYGDYARWQRHLLGSSRDPDSLVSAQLDFWQATLDGAPTALPLPTDRERPPVASHRGGTVSFDIDAAMHQDLLRLARDARATLFMVLHASLAALLTRLGAGTDLPIGSVVAGRTEEVLDDSVGFFVNTVVLRTDTSGDPSFTALLARVRETDLAAIVNQEAPFDLVVERCNPPRSLSHHPLFQVMLVLQNNADAVLDLPGVHSTAEQLTGGSAKFDLYASFMQRPDVAGVPGRLTATLEYATDVFDRATVDAIAAAWLDLLRTVCADPGAVVSSFAVGETLARRAAELSRRSPAVPAAAQQRPEIGTEPPSQAAYAQVLRRLFAEALGLPEVGIHDNFFELGGYSLLGARVAGRIRAELGVELGIRAIFEHPTVAGLARGLATGHEASGNESGSDIERLLTVLLPLRGTGGRPPLFCVHPATGIGWIYSALLGHLDPNVPLYALQSRALTDPAALDHTVEQIATDYLRQIRSVQAHGPYHLLGWSFGGGVAHEMAVQLEAIGEEVASLVILDGYPALDRRDGAGSPPPDESGHLLRLLASLGIAHETAGPMTWEQFTAIASRNGSPLAGMPAEAIATLSAVFARNNQIAGAITGRQYSGDLLLFTAEQSRFTGTPGAQAWAPFVAGDVTVHEIACEHGAMLQPQALAEIGPLVDDWLDAAAEARRAEDLPIRQPASSRMPSERGDEAPR